MSSPGGSPTGAASAAGAAVDGMELARRMVEAAEAAARAAEATARAVQQQGSPTRASSDDKSWWKLLPKPPSFDHSTRESEISAWKEWSWTLEQYLSSLDTKFLEDIEGVRRNLTTEVDMFDFSEEDKQRCSFLYGLLSSLVKQRALLVVKQVTGCNGLEAYRRLVQQNEPVSKNRSMGLLNIIMNWAPFTAKTSLMAQVLRLEHAFSEYEKLGQSLGDELKTAILLRSVTGQLKTWLQLQVKETTTYSQLREMVMLYDSSTTKWSEQMVLGLDAATSSSADGPVPMEVDRIYRGKDKGKGKYKGSKGSKGDNNGYYGQKGQEGKNQMNSNQKGKGKGGNYPSFSGNFTKGVKGKDFSKGKSKSTGKQGFTCNICGKPGHFARDCWNKTGGGKQGPWVRNVAESGDQDSQTSRPTQNSDTASSSQSTATAQSSMNTSNRVRRVVFDDIPEADSYVFDMCGTTVSDGPFHVYTISSQPPMDCLQLPESFSMVDGDTDFDEDSFAETLGDSDRLHSDSFECARVVTLDSLYSEQCSWSNVSTWIGTSMCHDSIGHDSQLVGGICLDDYEISKQSTSGRRVGTSATWKPSAIRTIQQVESIFDPDEPNYIIIDSGSDVTIVPSNFAECGIPIPVYGELKDCQGTSIATDGARQFHFELMTTSGKQVLLKERGFLSTSVSSPIISYGHLFRHGWCIDSELGSPVLRHRESGISIAMSFRNDSLVVEGQIRQIQVPIQQVSTVNVKEYPEADIPISWREAKGGWQTTALNHPMCRSNGLFFIDPVERFLVTEFPYRTTLAYDGTAWHVVELCKKIFDMDDRALSIGARGAVTLLTPEILSPEQMGFMVHEDPTSTSSAQASAPAQRMDDQVEIAGNPPVDRRPDAQLVPASNVQVVPDRSSITVNGVNLTTNSTIKLLRAACGYCGVSQSGSKLKLFNKLLEFYDRRQLELSQEVAASAAESLPVMKVQVPVERPDDPKLIAEHEVNHMPYAAWCEACVSGKARPDSHQTDRAARTSREISCVSFDFSFTGKDGLKKSTLAQDDRFTLVVLNAYDSQTGMIAAFPCRRKSDVHFLSKELAKFACSLGHSKLNLRCDSEPVLLRIQGLVQRILLTQQIEVTCSNSKVGDHGDNGWVENSVHRLRQMAVVLLRHVELKLSESIGMDHPLASWAFQHSAWILNRFCGKSGETPFCVTFGKDYTGKCCPFGETVMSFVATDTSPKGNARWMKTIYLGKTLNNDMYIVAVGRSIRLTRSVRRIFSNWKENLDLYKALAVQSWMVEGTLGTRLSPGVKKLSATAHIDEAASDPDSEPERMDGPMEGHGVDLQSDGIPIAVAGLNDVSVPAVVGDSASLALDGGAALNSADVAMEAAPTEPALPSSIFPEHSAQDLALNEREPKLRKMTPPPPSAAVAGRPAEEMLQEDVPEAKRHKLSVSNVGLQQFAHVDDAALGIEDSWELTFLENEERDEFDFVECEEGGDDGAPQPVDDRLWFPFSENEPELTADELEGIDQLADQFELSRLTGMKVLISRTEAETFEAGLDTPLSAKFVRTWRKKFQNDVPKWLRRSRLCAREYNHLSVRTDTYAPASSTAVNRLLPSLAVSSEFHKSHLLGSLDITDAYLQVKQEKPRVLRVLGYPELDVYIGKCLPGQRDGAKRWYSHLAQFLQDKFQAEACTEQPSIFKVSGGILLAHVDDILFLLNQNYLEQKFLPVIREEFKVQVEFAARTGGSFEFLKRLHVVDENYEKVTIYPCSKHIKKCFELFCKINGKAPKHSGVPGQSHGFASEDVSRELDAEKSAVFRSLVGALLYISHERADLQFSVKSLASYLRCPTERAWAQLGKLVSYCKSTEEFCISFQKCNPGTSLLGKVNGDESNGTSGCLLETFTDADWQGSAGCKSTSSAYHFLDGNLVYSTSRTQHLVSLSSTESEFYSLTSGCIDTLFLKHILAFMLGYEVTACMLVDNSACKQIAQKLGTSRLRHVRGRLLWIQQVVQGKEIQLKQVSTLWNVSDLGTKNLPKGRHLMLCFLCGFNTDDGPVGEQQFRDTKQKEFNRAAVRAIKLSMFGNGGIPSMSNASENQVAKHVMRAMFICSAVATGALGQRVASDEQAMEESLLLWTHSWMTIFAMVLMAIAVGWIFLMNPSSRARRSDEPEPDPEDGHETLLEPVAETEEPRREIDERKVYDFLSKCISRTLLQLLWLEEDQVISDEEDDLGADSSSNGDQQNSH